MDRQSRQGEPSFTLIKVVTLIAVAVAVGVNFFVAVYFFNQWYVRVNTPPEKKILVNLDSDGQDAAASSYQTGNPSDLTFFKNLTDTKIPYPSAPPTPSISPKASKPIPSPTQSSVPSAASKLPTEARAVEEKPSPQPALRGYTVQVGAFQKKPSAESLHKELETNGFTPHVVSVLLDNGSTLYRVRVGNDLTRSNADVLAAKIRTQTNLKPLVVPEK